MVIGIVRNLLLEEIIEELKRLRDNNMKISMKQLQTYCNEKKVPYPVLFRQINIENLWKVIVK
ncbi:hypothetical protein [Cetobacterium sp. 2A]|uniref:hypothetical protein n=1 Tax=Cetobacterium sp. 2A TaxID=2754723 RepID=UPI00163C6B6E|nr:hypothetical protein [Cetobacterium sp. 2A]